MKLESTRFFKWMIKAMVAGVTGICLILIPILVFQDIIARPETVASLVPFLIVAYAMAGLFLFALGQTYKLVTYIEEGDAFTNLSLQALRRIKQSAVLIIFPIIGLLSFLYFFGQDDYAPFVTLGSLGIFVSIVMATFASVLQKLLSQAIAIKSENDLIV